MKDDRSIKVEPSIENKDTCTDAILEMELFDVKPEQSSTRRLPRKFKHKDRRIDGSSVVAVLTI